MLLLVQITTNHTSHENIFLQCDHFKICANFGVTQAMERGFWPIIKWETTTEWEKFPKLSSNNNVRVYRYILKEVVISEKSINNPKYTYFKILKCNNAKQCVAVPRYIISFLILIILQFSIFSFRELAPGIRTLIY